jgi:chromosome segregation protein
MRLTFLEMAGFRGVRDTVRFEFPPGFVVLTGRNGSGKSTACDGIEYALTGRISKYETRTEKGESVEDYIWWRGKGKASECHVTLGLVTEQGVELTMRRTRDHPGVGNEHEILDALCVRDLAPKGAIVELCKTSLIRDETLAAMSVDLPETDRFAFVKNAVASEALGVVEGRSGALLAAIKKQLERAAVEHAASRGAVTALVEQISSERSKVVTMPDVSDAIAGLERLLGAQGHGLSALKALAQRRKIETRLRIDVITRLGQVASRLRERKKGAEALKARRSVLATDIETAAAESLRLEVQLATVEKRLGEYAVSQPYRLQMASLLEAGRAMGLRDGHCPLCATVMEESQFQSALADIARHVNEQDGEQARLKSERELARSRWAEVANHGATLRGTMAGIDAELLEIELLLRDLLTESSANQIDLDDALETTAFDAAVSSLTNELAELDGHASVLDLSEVIDRLADLEIKLESARKASVALEERMRAVQVAEQRTRNSTAGIKRAAGELVEERLAALEPMLKELYARLRPHMDWDDVQYHLRGDVRRFLSLRVGENMNPRFMFSSGQRRAAGLAFLLAVHLSRPWCRLRTLILDDPIQHIDDYRALHLTEVLSAIRRSGHQVICTVEDPDLAHLLSRRLSAGEDGSGVVYSMGYAPGDGVRILHEQRIRPPMRHVLLSA